MADTVLHIDASARIAGSTSRGLTAKIVDKIGAGTVIRRDLADALPHVTEDWINANFTPAEDRTEAQKAILAQSDALVQEVMAADTLVIGVPMYNFSVPASLKAWIDLIARAGQTFAYTENGPKGLLEGKKAIIAIASGGVPVGAPVDFTSNYMTHIMGFIGITDVTIISADQMVADPDAALAKANGQIDALAA